MSLIDIDNLKWFIKIKIWHSLRLFIFSDACGDMTHLLINKPEMFRLQNIVNSNYWKTVIKGKLL